MSRLPQPLHILYLNHDYTETAHVLRSPLDVAMKTSQEFGVGIDPYKGFDDDFWQRIDKAYNDGKWKGSSHFRVDVIGPDEITRQDPPRIPAEEVNLARIDAPLSENPAEPIYMLLMNQDYVEYAFACPDLKSVIGHLIKEMEIDTDEIISEEDFEPEFQAAYQNNWKGVLVIEVNPRSLEHKVIPIDELGFEMSDLEDTPDPAP